MSRSNFFQSEEALELLKEFKALFLNSQQPPDRVILDDVDFRKIIIIENRTAAHLRAGKKITFSKIGGKIYYLLSHGLDYLRRYQVDCIADNVITMQKSAKRTRLK